MVFAQGVEILELKVGFMGREVTVHPVLLVDPDGATLVDTGFPGQFEDLKTAVEQAVGSMGAICRILLTHQDIDHIGNAAAVKEAAGGADVLAHPEDVPYIEGRKRLIKADPERMRVTLASASPEVQKQAETVFRSLPSVQVDRTVADGDVLPVHGGLRVIHTPGHTPGHVSLYLPGERLLIAGDALIVEGEKVMGPNPANTLDVDMAWRSVGRLAAQAPDAVVAYHGGLCTSRTAEQMHSLQAGN